MSKVCPKHVELILEINKILLLHLVGFLYYSTYIYFDLHKLSSYLFSCVSAAVGKCTLHCAQL